MTTEVPRAEMIQKAEGPGSAGSRPRCLAACSSHCRAEQPQVQQLSGSRPSSSSLQLPGPCLAAGRLPWLPTFVSSAASRLARKTI